MMRREATVKQNGMTLIELLIAMTVVAILAAIAIPAYDSYTRVANRTDATQAMTFDAQALERCYSQAFTYAGCAAAPAGAVASRQGFYTVTIAVPTATSYTITATPLKAPQTNDSACQTFTLNSAGTQGATNGAGTANTQVCWGST